MLEYIPQDWQTELNDRRNPSEWRANLANLDNFLQTERNYHPTGREIFDAFHKTSFDRVRVVIIGQNPYRDREDATGLAFSTNRETTRSLDNIYEAIRRNDFEGQRPANGNLDDWARQGILLLNRVLTFRNDGNDENAHKVADWEQFTQAVVSALATRKKTIHFMLWGRDAQEIALPRDYPRCFIHDPYLPAQQRQDYVQVFLDSYQFLDVNDEIERAGREGELPINWFPPE